MQNSKAVQAWFQGKMASFRILGLVSKNEIRSREFSFSSRYMRVKIINLDLVSMPEIGGNFFSVSSRSLRVSVRNSRSRLDEQDWIGEALILVSRLKKRLSLTTALDYHTPSHKKRFRTPFYRTRVRSLVMLVSNSLPNSLTNSCLVNLMALYHNYLMMSQQLLNDHWLWLSVTPSLTHSLTP